MCTLRIDQRTNDSNNDMLMVSQTISFQSSLVNIIHRILNNSERKSSRKENCKLSTAKVRLWRAKCCPKQPQPLSVRISSKAESPSADLETRDPQQKWNNENAEEEIKCKEPSLPRLVLFDRMELVVGAVMGQGAFCEVHEVQDVVEVDSITNSININMLGTHSFSNVSSLSDPDDVSNQEQSRARQQLPRTCQQQIDDHDPDAVLHSSCRYVVKYLKLDLAEQRGYKVFVHAAADLVMEYHILSRLSHPNIVQLVGGGKTMMSAQPTSEDYATGRSNGNCGRFIDTDDLFIVLERLEGTLSHRIQHWKKIDCCRHHHKEEQPEFWATSKYQAHVVLARQSRYIQKLQCARDIASALAYLHEKKFVFRDLKPDNIMFAPNGLIKLVDFGLCRELPKPYDSASLRHGQCHMHREPVYKMSGVGTRRYMAPEVISGQYYNQKIDCYSWAMVFFEMLSLQKPFALYNREVHRILVCENEERPYMSSEIPCDAQKLLRHAWAQDPCDRLSMQQIYDTLGQIIDCAERRALTPLERSLKVVMEMADLLGFDDSSNDSRARATLINYPKSITDLTASTSTRTSLSVTAGAEARSHLSRFEI